MKPATEGSGGTYELLGDGSLRLTEPGYGTSTFTYRVKGDRLTLQGPPDSAIGVTLFESFPFTRVS